MESASPNRAQADPRAALPKYRLHPIKRAARDIADTSIRAVRAAAHKHASRRARPSRAQSRAADRGAGIHLGRAWRRLIEVVSAIGESNVDDDIAARRIRIRANLMGRFDELFSLGA